MRIFISSVINFLLLLLHLRDVNARRLYYHQLHSYECFPARRSQIPEAGRRGHPIYQVVYRSFRSPDVVPLPSSTPSSLPSPSSLRALHVSSVAQLPTADGPSTPFITSTPSRNLVAISLRNPLGS